MVIETGYSIRHQARWRPVLAYVSNRGQATLIVRLAELREHKMGHFRSLNDALACLLLEHQRNPRKMKAQK
jgi:hypothetical protein